MSIDQRLEIGSKLGPYLIVRFIEKGGMGEVYEAQDEFLKRRVALKVIRSSLADDQEVMSRFLSEGRTLAKVSSRYVVQIHNLANDQGLYYIVMEYVEGETLKTKIRNKAMNLHDAISVMLQLLEGVIALHKNAIVHRDLKPRNIIYQPNNEIKILDFGIAKVRDAAAMNETKSGEVVGSVMYMAPEIARGEEATAQSDIWSLGIIFYEILTGRRAISGKDEKEVFKKLVKYQMDFEPSDAAKIPMEIRLMVVKMCEKELLQRYSTASEVLADLKRFMMSVPWAEEMLESSKDWSISRNLNTESKLSSGPGSRKTTATKTSSQKRKSATQVYFNTIVKGAFASAAILGLLWFISDRQSSVPSLSKNVIEITTPQLVAQKQVSTESQAVKPIVAPIQESKPVNDRNPAAAETPVEEVAAVSKNVPESSLTTSEAEGLKKANQVKSKLRKQKEISAVEIPVKNISQTLNWNQGRLTTPVKMTWMAVKTVSAYTVEISDDSQFTNVIDKLRVSRNTAVWTQARPGRFYWRVRGEKGLQLGPFSSRGEVRLTVKKIELPGQLQIETSENGRNVASIEELVSVKWKPVPGIKTYLFQASRTANFKTLIEDREVKGVEQKVRMPMGKSYVRVMPTVGSERVSEWSSTMIIDVVAQKKLESPFTISPELGSQVTMSKSMSIPVVFKWQKVDEASGYEVQMASDEQFTNILFQQSTKDSKLVLEKAFPMGAVYWRVRAVKNTQSSTWSTINRFSVSQFE